MSVIIERGTGGSAGEPIVQSVNAIRFATIEEVLRLAPQAVYSEEVWLRLWRTEGTELLANPTLVASGLRPGIRQLWGTRAAYEPPRSENRYATNELGVLPVPLATVSSASSPQQIGPWIVLQWQALPGAAPGPVSPLTLTITLEEADD